MIKGNKKEKIAIEVIRTLYLSFNNIPEYTIYNDESPFNKAFYNAFHNGSKLNVQHAINSGYGLFGLNTTLGQTFFENVAHILSDGEKREYTSKKLGNLQVHKTQKENTNSIITKLSNSECQPNLERENSLLFIRDSSVLVNAIDFSTDVFIEDENKIVAIELKTVKPNYGEMHREKQKILEGKAALYKKFPNKEIEFYIGFPFDPTSDASQPAGYDKIRFFNSIINMNKYFAEKEAKVASELWNFLSGEENTMEQLLDIINTISTTEFMEKFNYINSNENRQHERYSEILRDWNLFSEEKLIENDNEIKSNIKGEKRLLRIYNQSPFKKGVYNFERYIKLIEKTKKYGN